MIMANLSPQVLDEIRQHTVLSDVVGKVVQLKKTSAVEWKGLCPFHKETAPSFTVNDQKGFYHCFGCGAHGDAIRWLTDKENLTFLDAVTQLARKAGIMIKLESTAMMEPNDRANSKKGGGKLSRSETVTVRLDPKLNYLCELASRAQRRTKSSFVEWAVAEALKNVELPDVAEYDSETGNEQPVKVSQKAAQLWHVDEPDRLAALALTAPSLLTHDEQLIWKLVRENGLVWRGHYDTNGDWTWSVREASICNENLRKNWDNFKAVALDGASPEILPKWSKRKSFEGFGDLDEEVPF